MNRILAESISLVKDKLGSRIKDITVERAVLGLFFTGVKLSTGHGGLSFTPVKEMPEAVCCPSSAKAMPLSGKLNQQPVTKYLDDLSSDNLLRKSLGIAALNALSMAIWAEEPSNDYETIYAADAFDEVDLKNYRKTVVVGALVPMLRKLIKEGADFKVLEQDIRTLKGKELDHYAPATDAPLYVPEADLLVLTGVTVLNDSIDQLLDLAKEGAEIIVTGPTASMLPDTFFARGVSILGGIQVTKADQLLDLISQGGSGYHFYGKYAEKTVIRKRA